MGVEDIGASEGRARGGAGEGPPQESDRSSSAPWTKALSFLQVTVLPGSATGTLSAFLLLFTLDPGDQTP